MTQQATEREEFEAWFTRFHKPGNVIRSLERNGDSYARLRTASEWLVWQAARHPRQEGEATSFDSEKLERDAFFETVRRYFDTSGKSAERAYVFYWAAINAKFLTLAPPSKELMALADEAATKQNRQPTDADIARLAADWAATPSDAAPLPQSPSEGTAALVGALREARDYVADYSTVNKGNIAVRLCKQIDALLSHYPEV